MKFALISQTLPPSPSGQAVTLWHLLRGVKSADYCLISARNWETNSANDDASEKLPVNYHLLPTEFFIRRGYRFALNWARQSFNIPYAILRRSRRIKEILRREGCGAVVACTGDIFDIPAAYLAARRLGIPFYAYIFDHYSYREWYDPPFRAWARFIESRVLAKADGVIAVNEVLQEDLRRQFGVEPTLIHNSFDIEPYDVQVGEDVHQAARPNDEIRVVYTGAIYEAHYDAFRNLIRAIEILGRPDVRLHLYTTQSRAELAAEGIQGPIVVHPHLPVPAMARVQGDADILFLGLAFDSPYPDLVRTSAPIKFGEYLAARRPVLVHAPRDAFICWYCREHDCGVVVDESDPSQLAAAMERILADAAWRRQIGERGWTRARDDFGAEAARQKFLELLNHH